MPSDPEPIPFWVSMCIAVFWTFVAWVLGMTIWDILQATA